MKNQYRNKEISWLSFNARVLQEARDSEVPLMERIKFLGIYSNNMDEFYRVRVATLKRLSVLGKESRKLIGHDPRKVLKEIQSLMIDMTSRFDDTYQEILKALETENIHIINEKQLDDVQGEFVKSYFQLKVRPLLFPVMLNNVRKFPELQDESIYLSVCLKKEMKEEADQHALIEIPSHIISRFLILPEKFGKQYLILLDDVIRYNLADIFRAFDYDQFYAYTVKLTRDSELDLEEDLSQSVIKKVSRGLRHRKEGEPIRFIYDASIPDHLLQLFVDKYHLTDDCTIVPGARYHNFKDFIKFPDFGLSHHQYPSIKYLPHKDIECTKSMFEAIVKKDILVHYPYQSFNYVIDLLREASIDPTVQSIQFTLYRVAKISSVVNALINAVKNGKKVTVVVELTARFDEEANIYWSNRMREEGVRVIYGVPGLKVHCKLCLITRKKKARLTHIAIIGTGNFNEDTARLYTDHALFTANQKLTREVAKVFAFFDNNYNVGTFQHLLVSPFNMRKKFTKLIKHEINNAKAGKPAYIFFKLNNLVDSKIIKLLYTASQAGVTVRLMVRSMFSVIPGVEGMSENIEARSLVDKFLEHSRLYVFANGGDEKIFISSADLMPRNIDRRVEVTCPIYDQSIQEQLRHYMEIQWQDNTKMRLLDQEMSNDIQQTKTSETCRAQWDVYDYLKALHTKDGS